MSQDEPALAATGDPADGAGRCPRCGSTALARVRNDAPWCSHCEWNLAAWPEPARKRGRKELLRRRKRAFELNAKLLKQFDGRRPGRPRPTRASIVLGVASLLLLLFDLGLLSYGFYVIVTEPFPILILGILLVLVGLELRPRFPKYDASVGQISRVDAPALFAIIDAAAKTLGGPRPDIVVLTRDFNAACLRSGFRRRAVLEIGLPLWAALSPAGRAALLGHELGHLTNNDPRSLLASQPALTTFARLADIFDPVALADADVYRSNVVSDLMVTALAYVVFAPLRLACAWVHRGLERVAAEDHQRAEIYADALGVRVGGSAGADELTRVLLLQDRVVPAITATARRVGLEPKALQPVAARAIDVPDAELKVIEQASLRYEAMPYASHPPSGLRRRLLVSWPQTSPAEPIPLSAYDEADLQLHRRYARLSRELTR